MFIEIISKFKMSKLDLKVLLHFMDSQQDFKPHVLD